MAFEELEVLAEFEGQVMASKGYVFFMMSVLVCSAIYAFKNCLRDLLQAMRPVLAHASQLFTPTLQW